MSTPYDYTTDAAVPIGLPSLAQTGVAPVGVAMANFALSATAPTGIALESLAQTGVAPVGIGLPNLTPSNAAPVGIALGDYERTENDAIPVGPSESLSLPDMPATFVPSFVEITSGARRLALLNANASDADKVLQGTVDGQLKSYQVRPGTDAEDLPGIVRPANFNAETNAFIFVQL